MSVDRPFDYLFKVRTFLFSRPHATHLFSSAHAHTPLTRPPHTLQPHQFPQILLVGDSGVGKSSLLLRFTSGEFEEASVPTIGAFCFFVARFFLSPFHPASTDPHALSSRTLQTQASTSASSSWSCRASGSS
jgi:hypothetical protein